MAFKAHTPKPTARQVASQVIDVLADVPRFLTAPLYRPWHLTWGATATEVSGVMPGDAIVPTAQYRTTRAVTIDAPPEQVWPWLVQVGCLKGGFYADDLLDNLAYPSSWKILPELQELAPGKWVPMSPMEPNQDTAFMVHSFEAPQWLLWVKPDSTWSWTLTALPNGRTRLVTRVHALYDWSRPVNAVLGVVLLEFGDFAMMRRMLLGIKARAERLHRNESRLPH